MLIEELDKSISRASQADQSNPLRKSNKLDWKFVPGGLTGVETKPRKNQVKYKKDQEPSSLNTVE